MTQSVQSLIVLGQSLGLQGFATIEEPAAEASGDQKPGAGAAALASGQQAGLKGFAVSSSERSQPPRKNESTMALAVRLGLPGFVQKEAAESAADPVFKATTVSPTIRVSPTPAPVASKMSKQRFVQIDIASGSLAAFTALEGKMGQSFAPNVRGQTSWLQRDNPDGGQTRAYPAMNTDLSKLEAMGSNLGVPALRMSVGPLPLSQFAVHTSAGRVRSEPQRSAPCLNPGVPDALRQALGR